MRYTLCGRRTFCGQQAEQSRNACVYHCAYLIRGSGLGYFIATGLLGLPYQFDPSVLVLGLVAGVIGVGAAGLWFTRRVLLTPPMVSLRQVA
jgi:hypothetical protein